eukprot:gene10263-biopygen11064
MLPDDPCRGNSQPPRAQGICRGKAVLARNGISLGIQHPALTRPGRPATVARSPPITPFRPARSPAKTAWGATFSGLCRPHLRRLPLAALLGLPQRRQLGPPADHPVELPVQLLALLRQRGAEQLPQPPVLRLLLVLHRPHVRVRASGPAGPLSFVPGAAPAGRSGGRPVQVRGFERCRIRSRSEITSGTADAVPLTRRPAGRPAGPPSRSLNNWRGTAILVQDPRSFPRGTGTEIPVSPGVFSVAEVLPPADVLALA